ncbi:putative coiled-coil domain-containing protein 104 [Diplonema papillatum]|nr:putative coiled-coil domain-containing protein 104 [Diplonema papillatum]KAJ9460577.1 putative coiled-coil domain-containing protein 104 [Diplonema papillatum]
MSGEFAWVSEWLLQFLKSPLWTTPVQSFIDENCECFEDGDEEENKLEYSIIHKKFCCLVDGILSGNLKDLGVPEEVFIDIVGGKGDGELDLLVQEYLLSMDDFPTFRKMMEKRNIELELEAMTMAHDDSDGDLLRMALTASIAEQDVLTKQLQMEDAELQHALALSLAAEEEKQRQREAEIQQQVKDRARQEESVEASQKAHESRKQELEEAVLQRRIENVQKAPEVTEKAAAEKHETKPASEPIPIAQKPPKEPEAPCAPPAPEAKRESRTSVATLDKVQLAPLGKGPGGASDPFAPKPALPGIKPGSKPSFDKLKTAAVERAKAEPARSAPAAPASRTNSMTGPAKPSAEEIKKREDYLKAQRDALVKKKKEAREKELDTYLREKTAEPPSAAPSLSQPLSAADQDNLEMRKALAKRVKADLLGK